MIVIDRVTKVYRNRHVEVRAVDDVSLQIDSGEVFGILGRSGAGKTTLLRCLNFLERPTSGSIIVDGLNLTDLGKSELRSARHTIATVFQHFNLLDSRTAAGNIELPLEVIGMPAAQRKARVAELLDLVGLSDRAGNHPSQLSGGQKQRVGIARALAANPSVLLCDEATSALDPATTEQILDLIKQINLRTGVTVVLITHEAEVVRRICDSAALMAGGRVVESGKLVDLLADPDSRLAELLLPIAPVDVSAGGEAIAGTVLTLGFVNQNVTAPVLSGLTRDLGVDVSILGGTIEQIAGHRIGRLRVAITDPPDGRVEAIEQYLTDRGVSVKAA